MNGISFKALVLLCMGLAACAAHAQNLPARNFLLELRQVDADAAEKGTGYSVGSRQAATPTLPAQQVQVRNGEVARFSQTEAQPQTWIKEAQAEGQNSGAGIKQELIWFQSGQSLQMRPLWHSGRRAEVQVQWQGESVGQQPGKELPSQQTQQLRTTVMAPLDEWVTLARSGTAPQPGVYRSDAASQPPRLLQLRVSLLP
jgi:hypothetical protein